MKNKHLVGKHSGIQAMSIVPHIKPRQHSFFARRMLKAVGKASVSRAGAKPASFTSKKVPAGKVAIYNSNFATFRPEVVPEGVS